MKLKVYVFSLLAMLLAGLMFFASCSKVYNQDSVLKIWYNPFFTMLIIVLFLFSCNDKDKKPNVVIIYTDDIGYGDIGVNGAKLIPTPNIDRLAEEGLQFTDGHCAASTCSPSRYALLTGEMGFRRNLGIQGVNAPATIQQSQFTMGKLFQQAGYKTGIVGKWHLGLGDGNIDWNGDIKPGPREAGFDYSFIIPYSNDRAPFVYLENQRVYNYDPDDPITVSKTRIPDSIPGTKYPDAILNPEAITVYEGDRGHQCSVINGVGRIGYMKGGKKALWSDNNIAFDLVEKTENFIKGNRNNPFFLLLTTNDIHAPRLPNQRFRGSTSLGYRGDNIVQLDWTVGRIMEILKEIKIDKKTLLIFTSDNGPVYIDGGYQDGSDKGEHKAAGIYRGGKYSMYEGGTRVPFIIRWPSVIEPGISGDLVSQADLLASFAGFLDIEIPEIAASDSRNYWDTFIGKEDKGAGIILEQANTRESGIAIRKGSMKYINLRDERYEMYNLQDDPSEKRNIILEEPKIAEELHNDLQNLTQTTLTEFPEIKKDNISDEVKLPDFLKLQFGMFIHFNMATYMKEQWVEGYSDPSEFDPGVDSIDTDAWADAAVAAGMKYAVLTAKHVGGFCLWDSKYTTYDVMHPDCPYQKDLVAQFIKSFTERGLKVGLYYCWRHPGFDAKKKNVYKVLPPECDPSTHSLEEQIEFQKAQIAELLIRYPEVFYIWNDALDPQIMAADKILPFFREVRPGILLSANWWDWSKKGTPFADIAVTEQRHFPENNGTAGETCWHLEQSWFWNNSWESKITATEIVNHINMANSRKANFLLNVGPDRNGKIVESSISTLIEIGKERKDSACSEKPFLTPDQKE